MSDMEQSVNFIHTDITKLKEKCEKMESENKRLKERLDKAEMGRKDLEKKVDQQKLWAQEGLNDIERHARGFSIRIEGIRDTEHNNNYRQIVSEILVKQKLINTSAEEACKMIEHAHPIGPKRRDVDTITIIARQYSHPIRNSILTRAKTKHCDADEPRAVEDMTKIDHKRRKDAYPKMKEAYENGQKATFRRGKLIIDGKIVTV